MKPPKKKRVKEQPKLYTYPDRLPLEDEPEETDSQESDLQSFIEQDCGDR